jgi:hypothetical protein
MPLARNVLLVCVERAHVTEWAKSVSAFGCLAPRVLNRCEHFGEGTHLLLAHVAADRLLEREQVPVDLAVQPGLSARLCTEWAEVKVAGRG